MGMYRPWNSQLAQCFNEYISARDGHPVKPIMYDIPPSVKSFSGQHCDDRIRLRKDLPPVDNWRTFLHEIAHYVAKGHRRAFVQELARVYQIWIEFLQKGPQREVRGEA